MRVELDDQDLGRIVEAVFQKLRPHLQAGCTQDAVFDKKGLAEYLHVDISWIEKQITARTIPYFKAGKYTRFKRSNIDRWIETRKVDPILDLKSYGRGR